MDRTRPTAAPAHFPYHNHRTIEQVDAARERQREAYRKSIAEAFGKEAG